MISSKKALRLCCSIALALRKGQTLWPLCAMFLFSASTMAQQAPQAKPNSILSRVRRLPGRLKIPPPMKPLSLFRVGPVLPWFLRIRLTASSPDAATESMPRLRPHSSWRTGPLSPPDPSCKARWKSSRDAAKARLGAFGIQTGLLSNVALVGEYVSSVA